VYSVLCERGDLIGVPAGTRHWFDMGPRPSFTAIRLFTSPEGWVARFTGSDCARRFPRHEEREEPEPATDLIVQAILTDVEGTTSSLSFVKDVLFPYARAHLPAWVRAHRGEARVEAALQAVRALEGDPALGLEAILGVLDRWMVADEKVTPLKTLQGFVWAEGYESGALAGHVYEDAARKLGEWHAAGLRLFVFSSGSVEAQRLLFAHSTCGDLAPLFAGYFDTTTGPKAEAASYAAIARLAGLAPEAILFLSDSVAELDAARRVGLRTTWLARDGASARSTHPAARSFDDVRASPPRERSTPALAGHDRDAARGSA
jgi:enolase-phosphatase E1